LASETLSGLSEDGHAGGKYPRPCLFERLGRLLEKAKPDVVFACYGMNDGIYQPLDAERFGAFKKGVTKLLNQCKEAGVKEVYLITPPIYDFAPKEKDFNYDAVLTVCAKWETELKVPGVRVIDLQVRRFLVVGKHRSWVRMKKRRPTATTRQRGTLRVSCICIHLLVSFRRTPHRARLLLRLTSLEGEAPRTASMSEGVAEKLAECIVTLTHRFSRCRSLVPAGITLEVNRRLTIAL
jgi:hypothetical protein